MADICRYCKVQGKKFEKLTPELLKFVRWKVPSVTEKDVFCRKCYKKLQNKYEEVIKYHKTKNIPNVTSTSEESSVSSFAINNEKNNNLKSAIKNPIALKKQVINDNEVGNSDELIARSSSFSITNSEESIKIESKNKPPKQLRLVQQSIQPFVHHVAKNSKTTSIIQKKKSEISQNQFQEKSIIGSDNAENNQLIVPQRILPEMEEVEYDGSDDDIIDPGISHPTIQPLIKRRKVVRSKREPLNWSYKLGG